MLTPEIMLYTRLDRPVFVETIEPRDRAVLERLGTNLQVVPVAANWWADHRGQPARGVERDIDVAMVAAWADIKRHWRVFRALADLRLRGHKLRVALVGYKYDRTREEIEALASYFGVRDQIQTHERISQDEVTALLWRSKIHVLWSRRECANRAIVEAMLADVPVIVRDGMTFGFRYPYINEQTGRFVHEDGLADAMLEMIQTRNAYRPRDWVLANMTCEQATTAVETRLRDAALAARRTLDRGPRGEDEHARHTAILELGGPLAIRCGLSVSDVLYPQGFPEYRPSEPSPDISPRGVATRPRGPAPR